MLMVIMMMAMVMAGKEVITCGGMIGVEGLWGGGEGGGMGRDVLFFRSLFRLVHRMGKGLGVCRDCRRKVWGEKYSGSLKKNLEVPDEALQSGVAVAQGTDISIILLLWLEASSGSRLMFNEESSVVA